MPDFPIISASDPLVTLPTVDLVQLGINMYMLERLVHNSNDFEHPNERIIELGEKIGELDRIISTLHVLPALHRMPSPKYFAEDARIALRDAPSLCRRVAELFYSQPEIKIRLEEFIATPRMRCRPPGIDGPGLIERMKRLENLEGAVRFSNDLAVSFETLLLIASTPAGQKKLTPATPSAAR